MKNSLKNVCLRHNINFSSAKNVLQIYRKEGRLEKKMFRQRKHKKLTIKSDTAQSGEASSNEQVEKEGE